MKRNVAMILLWTAACIFVLAYCSGSPPQESTKPQIEASDNKVEKAPPAPGAEQKPLQLQEAPLADAMGASKSDGKALLEERCTTCHDLTRTISKKKTAEGWKATVERMVGKGAVLNADEQQVLIDYLTKNFSP